MGPGRARARGATGARVSQIGGRARHPAGLRGVVAVTTRKVRETMGRKNADPWQGASLYTVGHSTRALEELVALLRSFEVAVLVDGRTIPRSRHNPQFEGAALATALRRRRLRYVHLPLLG